MVVSLVDNNTVSSRYDQRFSIRNSSIGNSSEKLALVSDKKKRSLKQKKVTILSPLKIRKRNLFLCL